MMEAAVLPHVTDVEVGELDLGKTPERAAKMMYDELLSSYKPSVQEEFVLSLKHFDGKSHDGGMVVVRDIPFYSLCAHHMIPFFGTANVGYIPSKKIAGLSKIPRIVDFMSKKLQTQEGLGSDIADYLVSWLDPIGTMVVLEGRHLCMEMRGVRKPGATTLTSAIRGNAFEAQVKSEFLALMKG